MTDDDDPGVSLFQKTGPWGRTDAVAAYLNADEDEVVTMFEAGELAGIQLDEHGVIFPFPQFSEGGVSPGVAQVWGALDPLGPFEKALFLAGPTGHVDGRSSWDELAFGHLADVLRAVRREHMVRAWVADVVVVDEAAGDSADEVETS